MTSTYRPFFPLAPLVVLPPLLPAVGGPPSKSSNPDALLSALAGLGGGPAPGGVSPELVPGGVAVPLDPAPCPRPRDCAVPGGNVAAIPLPAGGIPEPVPGLESPPSEPVSTA